MSGLELSKVESHTALKHLRANRDMLTAEQRRLELRRDTHGDGTTQGALLVLSTEVYLLEEVITKLWAYHTSR